MDAENDRKGGWFSRYGPTALVFIALGGVAYWGHHTGWKAPKFSALWGKPAMAQKEDWCEAHGVPDSKCVACHPELAASSAPSEGKDWCQEHGLPESQCTICHPEIALKGSSSASKPDVSAEADPTAPQGKDPMACRTHTVRIQFASPEAVRKAGIRLEQVRERPLAVSVTANGEVEYDQTRTARLSSRVPGTVWRVEKEIGQKVRKGDILALVDAAEVGRAKSELLQALAQVDVKGRSLERIRQAAEAGFRGRGELQEAEAGLREARIRLFNSQQALVNLGLPVRVEDLDKLPEDQLAERIRFLGLPEEEVKSLRSGAASANLIPIAASLDGIVVSREATVGESVDSSKPLFVVSDTSRLWVMMDVRSEDAGHLALGQPVLFHPDGGTEDAIAGKIAWISTAVDEKTRTVKARADVENAEGRLRARAFGTARIRVRDVPSAAVIPSDAIQWEGCCHVVFVRQTDELFQTRKVRPGVQTAGMTEILAGVLPGEEVVTVGAHTLKSELLKNEMGAG